MSHPQPQLRAYLDDGPYSGETVSVSRGDDDEIPRRITIGPDDLGRGPHGVTDHDRDKARPAAYEFHHANVEINVWVYRVVTGAPAPPAAHS